MKTKLLLKKHPSLLCADQLIEICKPLEEKLGIDYFAHVNLDAEGNFTALGKNTAFVRHYYENGYYDVDSHLKDLKSHEEYVVQDSVVHEGRTESLFRDCSAFKLHHIFSILQKNAHSVDAFHFATTKENHHIYEKYLSNIDYLKLFILHFKDKVYNSKELKQAYDLKVSVNDFDGYKTDNINTLCDELIFDRIYKAGEGAYITKRELECLRWLSRGKTIEEVAKVLSIAPRTVKAHVSNMKAKLNCENLFQLGIAYSQLDANFLA